MIVQLGGKAPARAAREMHRAIDALTPRRGGEALVPIEAAAPRAFTLSKQAARVERERMRAKVAGTRTLRDALRAALDATRDDALRSMGVRREADGRRISDEVDRLHFDERHLAAAFRPTIEAMFRAGLESAYHELAARQPKRESSDPAQNEIDALIGLSFDLEPRAAVEALQAATLTFSRKVIAREKLGLKLLLIDALEEGDSTDEIADRIRQFFADGIHIIKKDADPRAEREEREEWLERTIPEDAWIEQVARTETARAHTAGVVNTYKKAGITTVRWIAAEDERTCPVCADLDGAVVKLGEAFPGTDAEEPPEHPSCRCTIVAADDALPGAA